MLLTSVELGRIAGNFLTAATSEKESLNRAIEHDEFELLIQRSIEYKTKIMVTTTANKVYIGLVSHTPNPAKKRAVISIIPLLSGFRDTEKHELYITTTYGKPIFELLPKESKPSEEFKPSEELIKRIAEDFTVVIPVEQISICQKFDLKVYGKYFKRCTNKKTGTSNSGASQ